MSTIIGPPSLSSINPTRLIKGACPVLADLCCYGLLRKSLSPKKSSILAGLAGIAVLFISCPRTKTAIVGSSLFYLAYKVSHYFLTQTAKPSEPPAPKERLSSTPPASRNESAPAKPSGPLHKTSPFSEITTKYDNLLDQVTMRFEGPFNIAPNCGIDQILQVIETKEGFQKEKRESEIRRIWNSKEVAEQSAQLVKEAGAEMLKIYYNLLSETSTITHKDDRYKAMAELLVSDERYSKKFYPSNTKTILHIYRFVRGLRYIIQCPLLEHNQVKESKKLFFHTHLTEADVLSFSEPGTPQYACREAYNKVIEVYTPLIPHLPPEFKLWLIKDEAGTPFAIVPPKK
jgi:hypothetical protein